MPLEIDVQSWRGALRESRPRAGAVARGASPPRPLATPPRAAFRAAGGALLVALLAAGPARAAAPAGPALERLDPRLAALTSSDAVVPVWVTFADKGDAGPADLAARLAEARARLSPRNLARRLRAHVSPLVSYDDLPVHAPYLDDLRARGFEPYGVSRWGNEAAVRAPGTRLAELAGLPQVAGVRPVERARALAREPAEGPVAPPSAGATRGARATSLSYGLTLSMLSQIQVPAVHDSGFIGTGVVVCLLDDGFNYYRKHEALVGADVPPGFVRDFVRGTWDPTDTLSQPGIYQHGTWTFGCLAGNKPGTYVGAAPGATYALGRTEFDPTESTQELVWWRMGAEWADSLGADVISSSLGYNLMDNPADDITWPMLDGHTSIVSRAAEIAAAKGILVVNSAGNDGQQAFPLDKVSAPADVNGDSLIAVGAVDASGVRAVFSSIGPTYDRRIKPDLMARGLSNPLVDATGNPNAYTAGSGTSFSCPITAGLAACLLQARPAWSAVTVIRALRETASRAFDPDTLDGYGIPNGLAALRWIPDTAGVPPPPLAHVVVAISRGGPNPMLPGGGSWRVRVALGSSAPPAAPVRVRLVDASGRALRTLFHGTLMRGESRLIEWDGRDGDGRLARPGIFFVVAESEGYSEATRVVRLRSD